MWLTYNKCNWTSPILEQQGPFHSPTRMKQLPTEKTKEPPPPGQYFKQRWVWAANVCVINLKIPGFPISSKLLRNPLPFGEDKGKIKYSFESQNLSSRRFL